MSDGSAAGALLRYRVMAYVTGTVLLANCLISIPLQIAGHPALGHVGWTIHGGLFIVYCLTALLLGMRVGWSLKRMAVVMLAGTIPVMTFFAEHNVARELSATA